ADGTYSPNTTPIILDQTTVNKYFYPVSSNFIEDGSYIRLSYVTVGYDMSKLLSKNSPVKGLNVSLTGRNLFLLTKYSGSDPQVQESGSANGSGTGGFDRYNVPNTRSFNLSLKATF
ncbi:MAG: SusC/RagA family TonB-linked outer membrane protein, partial [Muribaculaceae bacterium]|nr:SusC/RagA family TonB-linked outer membrane protein [Muribaculaceae bacterium]